MAKVKGAVRDQFVSRLATSYLHQIQAADISSMQVQNSTSGALEKEYKPRVPFEIHTACDRDSTRVESSRVQAQAHAHARSLSTNLTAQKKIPSQCDLTSHSQLLFTGPQMSTHAWSIFYLSDVLAFAKV